MRKKCNGVIEAATCLKLLKTSRDVAKFQKNELERI